MPILTSVCVLTVAGVLPILVAPLGLTSAVRTAVLDLRPATDRDLELAVLMTEALVRGVRSQRKGKVLGTTEIRGILNATAFAQLTGCDDERCVANLPELLAFDAVVTGRIGVLNGETLVFLALLDPEAGSVRARASHVFSAKRADLVSEMTAAAKKLLHPRAMKAGDALLSDLRIGVIVDEIDDEGRELRMRPLETCINNELLGAKATLISPSQVARIKRQAGAREFLAGGIPDSLTAAEVDVLLAGVVQYALAAESMGVKNYQADLNVQMIKVDTGEIIASDQHHTRSPGHTVASASRAAGNRLCAKVKPALLAALSKRQDRGNSVVFELSGQLDGIDPKQVGATLERLEHVARTRVRKFAADGLVLQVVVVGGDGVSLAIDMIDADIPYAIEQATSGKVRVSF